MFPERRFYRLAVVLLFFLRAASCFGAETPLSVETGERFTISLPGEGWIFMGESRGSTDILLQQRSFDPGFTNMDFTASAAGRYDLIFEYQDFITGENRRETREVHVGTSAGISSQKPVAVSTAAEPEDPTPEREAPVQYENLSAETLLRDSAYYQKNSDFNRSASLLTMYAEKLFPLTVELVALLEVQSQYGSREDLGKILNEIDFNNDDLSTLSPETFEQLCSIMDKARLLDSLEFILIRRIEDCDENERPALLFKLAELYHYAWDPPRMEEARRNYDIIYSSYPYSAFWAQSRDRLERMNQHYFQIR